MGPEPQTFDKAAHVRVLDGFRGIAIALVTITHSSRTGYHPVALLGPFAFGIDTFQDAGALGVNLFFYLSGFVLFLPYARHALGLGERPGLWHFIDRRFIKIVPSFAVAVLVVAAIFNLDPPTEADRFRQILTHLTFTFPFWHDTFFGLSGAFWTMGVEVQFYVLFPLIAAAMSRKPVTTYLVLAAIGSAYRIYMHVTWKMDDAFYGNQLPGQLDTFGIGMLSAYVFLKYGRYAVRPSVRQIATAAALLLSAASYGLLVEFAHATRGNMPPVSHAWLNDNALLVSWVFAGLVLSTLFAAPWWRKLITLPPLLWLSTISYNLYLWQVSISSQCAVTGFPCAGRLAPWATVEHWDRQYFINYFAISLAVGAAMTYLIERPLLALGTRAAFERFIGAPLATMARRWPRPITAAAAAVAAGIVAAWRRPARPWRR